MKPITKILFLTLCTVHLFAASGRADTVSYVDENNRVIVNGEPFFPIGLYVVECTNGSYVNELDEIANSPFNTLVNYAVNECGSAATYQQIRDYLDELSTRDLYLIYSLKEYVSACNQTYGVCDDPGPLSVDSVDAITEKVTNHIDHDAVVAWYLNDETCPDCLEQLEDGYNLIKSLDANHAIWSVHWNTNWLLQEAHTTDIVGADSYPIPDNPITWVSNVVDNAMEAGKPLWFVPQLFNWWGKRPPTKAEMRAMTYLATNHGAKGLIYYSYFDIRNDADYAERWSAIKDIASEIDQFKDVLLSTDQTNETDISCDSPDIDFKLMADGNTHYLFAVNTAVDTHGDPVALADVSFTVNLLDKPARIPLLFEETDALRLDEACRFHLDFRPYEVHVLQWVTNCSPGDLNGDGTKDTTDVAIFSGKFGKMNSPCQSSCDGDFDDDGEIDGADLARLASVLGTSQS